jgi:probable phosphoglycerate mutase
MDLLLIRHALPVRKENTVGPADPELSIDGHKQSALLAAYLDPERFDAIYSSPMARARQTAEPLAARQDLPIVIVDGVAEYDREANEYVPIEELKASGDPRWFEMTRGVRPPGAPSAEDFQKTVVAAVEDLIHQHIGGKIAIVCHGGVINAYLSYILRYDDPNGFFYPNYTSIHRLVAAKTGQRSIYTLNETAHLRGTGLPIGILQHH